MLRAIDTEECVQINVNLVPSGTFLHKLLLSDTKFHVNKDEKGNTITGSKYKDLVILQKYLHEGYVGDKVEKCLLQLDYFGIYTSKCEYNSDFHKIKLEEDWFRRVLYNPEFDPKVCKPEFKNISNQIHSCDFQCIPLTDEILESFTLMSNVHYLLARNFYGKENSKVSTFLQSYINRHENKVIPSHIYLLHSYPRLYVKYEKEGTETIINTIQKVNDQFLKRDKMFNNQVIRENFRYRRPRMFNYDEYEKQKAWYGRFTYYQDNVLSRTISSKWKNTLNEMQTKFQKTRFNEIFTDMENFWDNVLLAGGSVLNLIISCNIITDYDIFFYGISKKEATKKVLDIIHHTKKYCKRKSQTLYVTRTEKSITLTIKKFICIQLILRLYSSVSEIIHGFDVDCSCVGYTGSTKTFYLTKRSHYSIMNMNNTIDFDRASPTYEPRLSKYQQRGFSTNIPKPLSVEKINLTLDIEEIHKYRNSTKEYKELSYKIYKKHCVIEKYKITDKKAYEQELSIFNKEHSQKYPPLRGIEILMYEHEITRHKSLKFLADYSVYAKRINYEFKDFIYRQNGKNEIVSYTQIFHPEINDIFTIDITSDLRISDFKISLSNHIKWKTTQPGEQFTSTFHKTVLNDVRIWYQNRFLLKELKEEDVEKIHE